MGILRLAFSVIKWGLFTAILAFCGLFLYVSWTADAKRDNTIPAIAYCKTEIEKQALDPASVEWVDPAGWHVETDGGAWTVRAIYRAKNAFGGKVVDTATCHLKETDSGRLSTLVLLTK